MSADQWEDRTIILHIRTLLKKRKFADRVQMIKKLLTIIHETLDDMEAEVKKECG